MDCTVSRSTRPMKPIEMEINKAIGAHVTYVMYAKDEGLNGNIAVSDMNLND